MPKPALASRTCPKFWTPLYPLEDHMSLRDPDFIIEHDTGHTRIEFFHGKLTTAIALVDDLTRDPDNRGTIYRIRPFTGHPNEFVHIDAAL